MANTAVLVSRLLWLLHDIQYKLRFGMPRIADWREAVDCLHQLGMSEAARRLEVGCERVSRGRKATPSFVDFVQSLSASIKRVPLTAGTVTPNPVPAAVKAREESEGKGATGVAPGQEQVPPSPTREAVLRKMEPAVRKAYLAFQYAESFAEKRLEDREAYDWLHENGIDQGKSDLGELTDYELPDSLDTFRRYLGTARKALGESKYTRRGRREHGRSIARGNRIEYQQGDET